MHGRSIVISGIGLIGGSLAGALSKAGWQVLLDHHDPAILAAARAAGVGQPWQEAPEDLAGVQLVVAAGPVDAIAAQLQRLAPLCPAAALSDVGSVKLPIEAAMLAAGLGARFVGAHPMAGSHQSGFAHADAELFRHRLTIITPHPGSTPAAVAVVEAAWRDAGSRIRIMAALAHDEAVACASHLPHVLAAVAASALPPAAVAVAASGFGDTTRVAAGDAALWSDILLANRQALAPALDQASALIADLRAALANGDRTRVQAWLRAGQAGRARFDALQAEVRQHGIAGTGGIGGPGSDAGPGPGSATGLGLNASPCAGAIPAPGSSDRR